jgi:hypothetical protein
MSQELLRVMAEVCESLAFLTPTGPGEVPGPAAQELLLSVPFSGVRRGRVLLALGPGLAGAAAANIAPGAEATPDDRLEAAKELANVIAGNAIPALLGTSEEFLLAPPERLEPAPLPGEAVAMECLEGVLAAALVED